MVKKRRDCIKSLWQIEIIWTFFEGRCVMSDYDVPKNGIAICWAEKFIIISFFFLSAREMDPLAFCHPRHSRSMLNIQQLKCSRLINFWSFSKAYALSGEIKCWICTKILPHRKLRSGGIFALSMFVFLCQRMGRISLEAIGFQESHFEPFTHFAQYIHSFDPVTYK